MRTTVISICFISGLLMAGSTGTWFPWLNIVGAFIFALVVPLTWKEQS